MAASRSSGLACVCLALLGLGACCRVGAATRPFTAEELETARREQVERGGGGFASGVVGPFVIMASEPLAEGVRDEAVGQVGWASRLLRADYFEHDPGAILTIWVFPDPASYMRGASAVLGIVPDTPYGFYRPCRRVLVVDAGHGYGTLVHELVHAYMDGDFPSAPTWLNEGLASLFEAPREEDGHLRGAVNWRLTGLQTSLRAGAAPSFERMSEAGRGDFSGKEGWLYYATARYLCFYLQERGLLRTFYRTFRARVQADRTGLATLAEVTGHDARTLRGAWEAFVAGLRYEAPRR